MNECDYRYIMDDLTEDYSLDELSDKIGDTGIKTIINGKKYNLSEQIFDFYEKEYKGTVYQAVVRISYAAHIDYASLYDAIIAPIKLKKEKDIFMINNIYVSSLFNSDINAAVKFANDIEPQIFGEINKLSFENTILEVGAQLYSNDTYDYVKDSNIYYTFNKFADGKIYIAKYECRNNDFKRNIKILGYDPKLVSKWLIGDISSRYPECIKKVIENIYSENYNLQPIKNNKIHHL